MNYHPRQKPLELHLTMNIVMFQKKEAVQITDLKPEIFLYTLRKDKDKEGILRQRSSGIITLNYFK